MCEQRTSDERKYYLTNHPASASRLALVRAIKACWVCEQAQQQPKDELELDHFEGRSWGKLHHHAMLTSMALTYLQQRRLAMARRFLDGKTATRRARATAAAEPARSAWRTASRAERGGGAFSAMSALTSLAVTAGII